ncbi:hypothetical protein M8J76_014212 [Diaphorina citri]|nr:hypothetical protein M8J76_014212 [Diaphorina citri]
MHKVVWQDGEKAKSVPFTEWFNTKSVPFTEWFNAKSESISDQTRKLDEAQDFRMMHKVVWQDGEKAKSVPFTEWFNTKSVPFTEWFSSKSESINDQTRKLDEAQDFRMMDKVV